MSQREYVRLMRLESDHRAMQQLEGPVKWEALTLCDPQQGIYPTKYRVTYQFLAPTINGDRREHTLDIDCSSADYPLRAMPIVSFHTPHIRHPHVWKNGNVCLGGFPVSETVADLCIRLARLFQYDANTINERDPATREYLDWYIQQKHALPTEPMKLPYLKDETKSFRTKEKRISSDGGSLRIKDRR